MAWRVVADSGAEGMDRVAMGEAEKGMAVVVEAAREVVASVAEERAAAARAAAVWAVVATVAGEKVEAA